LQFSHVGRSSSMFALSQGAVPRRSTRREYAGSAPPCAPSNGRTLADAELVGRRCLRLRPVNSSPVAADGEPPDEAASIRPAAAAAAAAKARSMQRSGHVESQPARHRQGSRFAAAHVSPRQQGKQSARPPTTSRSVTRHTQ
jgi:hypothetical protein